MKKIMVALTTVGILASCSSEKKTTISSGPTPNPFLASECYAITHFNTAQTDAFPYEVKKGEFKTDLSKMPLVKGGPVNLMTLASSDKNYMWAVATDRVAYVLASEGKWEEVARSNYEGVTPRNLETLLSTDFKDDKDLEAKAKELLGESPHNTVSNGLYTLVDKDNTVYMNVGTKICAYGLIDAKDPKKGIELKRSIEMANLLPKIAIPGKDSIMRLIGMSMTYDGFIVAGALNGVAIVDRELTSMKDFFKIEEGQLNSNSISIDSKNAIYLASGSLIPGNDGIMHKIVWTGKELSGKEADGAWTSPYAGGPYAPAVKEGTASGSTPTLMGFADGEDKLVVITDGQKKANIVAFWRDAIPADFKQVAGTKSNRIAHSLTLGQAIKGAEWFQSEQSVVVGKGGAFVVNNIPLVDSTKKYGEDKLVEVMSSGPLTPPPFGVERVTWSNTTHKWESLWTRADVNSTSMVPVVSLGSDICFVSGYDKTEGWIINGLDWNTGKTVYKMALGKSGYGNGAYALLQFLENGDLLYNSIGGVFRIR